MFSASQPLTATEQIRWFDEVWNHGRRETIFELLLESAILHDALSSTAAPRNSRASTIPYVRNSRTSKLRRSFLLQKVITSALTGPAQ
jgi:hypothetical protein